MVDRNNLISLIGLTTMVTSDTGLPDPDNPNNELRVSDEDVILVTDDDEDSDDQETITLDEYQPLPMEDTADSNCYSSEDEAYGYQMHDQISENSSTSSGRRRSPMEEVVMSTLKQAWNDSRPTESNIEMDSKKIDEVKEAMSNITLPPSAIPEWANSVPEDEWKQHLLNRLQSNQERKK